MGVKLSYRLNNKKPKKFALNCNFCCTMTTDPLHTLDGGLRPSSETNRTQRHLLRAD